MNLCIFEPTEQPKIFRCRNCGFVTNPTGSPAERIYKKCPRPDGSKPLPSITKRGWSYAKAVAKWKAAGKPLRSQKKIDALLKICNTCEQYNPEKEACAKCGCNINAQRKGLANKLAMATETCPLEPPKWT